MPDLTLSVTDAQATRIKDALGHRDEDSGEWVVASGADVVPWIKRQLRAAVLRRATGIAHITTDAAVQTELTDEGWND